LHLLPPAQARTDKKTTVQPPWAGSGSRGPRRGHGDCALGGFKLACASPGRALGVRQGTSTMAAMAMARPHAASRARGSVACVENTRGEGTAARGGARGWGYRNEDELDADPPRATSLAGRDAAARGGCWPHCALRPRRAGRDWPPRHAGWPLGRRAGCHARRARAHPRRDAARRGRSAPRPPGGPSYSARRGIGAARPMETEKSARGREHTW
jgi:hypothetical protein